MTSNHYIFGYQVLFVILKVLGSKIKGKMYKLPIKKITTSVKYDSCKKKRHNVSDSTICKSADVFPVKYKVMILKLLIYIHKPLNLQQMI